VQVLETVVASCVVPVRLAAQVVMLVLELATAPLTVVPFQLQVGEAVMSARAAVVLLRLLAVAAVAVQEAMYEYAVVLVLAMVVQCV
jgi:hypothetical protein